jgi:hypothetical protein
VVVAIVLFYRRRVKRGMAGNEASNIDRSLSQTSQVPPPFPPTTQMVEARFTPPPPPPLQPPPLRPFNTFPAAPSSLRTWQTPSPDVPPEFATTGLFISQNPSSERVVTPVRPPVSAADYRGYLAAQPSGLAHEPVSPLSDYGSDNPVTSRQDETLTSASYNPRRYSQDLTAPSPGRWSLFPRTTRENDYYPPA